MIHSVSTANSSAHCTLHTAQCTLRTAPAPANAPESEHVHFILLIENCTLHNTDLYCILETYTVKINICLCWSQDLHGKMYLGVSPPPLLSPWPNHDLSTMLTHNCRLSHSHTARALLRLIDSGDYSQLLVCPLFDL